MKSKTILTLTVLLIATQLFGQLYKVPFEQKIRNATLIVEGKVIITKSYVGNDHKIYTANKVKIYKSFKGVPTAEFVTIITKGGKVNGLVESWSHLLQLNQNEAGIFSLIETNRPLTNIPDFPSQGYEVYSSSQGFFKYRFNKEDVSASAPFAIYENIEEELYDVFRDKFGVPVLYDTPEWEEDGFGKEKCIVYKFDVSIPNPQNPLEIEALVSIKSTQGQFYLYQSAIISEYNSSVLGENIIQSGAIQFTDAGISALSNYNVTSTDLSIDKMEAKVTSNSTSFSSMFLLDENYSQLLKLKITLEQFGDPEILVAQSEMQQYSEFYNPENERPERFECIRVEGDFDSKFTCVPPAILSFFPDTVRAGTFDTLTIIGTCFDTIRGSSTVEFTNSKEGPFPIDWVEPLAGDYVFWSDNMIRVIVPSHVPGGVRNSAGTGRFRVNRFSDGADTSNTALIVKFSAHNQGTLFFDTPSQSSIPVYIGNYNSQGGQSIYYGSTLKNDSLAIGAFERALVKWRCATRVNYIVEDSVDIADLSTAGRVDFAPLSVGVLAATANLLPDYVNCDSSGVIVGANREDFYIEFNSIYYWYTDTLMPPLGADGVLPDTFDLESRALHELGHAHLLKHSNAANDMMHYTDLVIPTDYRRDFSSNDIEGGEFVVEISSEEASDSCQIRMEKISLDECSDISTALIELTQGNSIQVDVFPNPSKGIFSLRLKSSLPIQSLGLVGEIFDVVGRKIASQELKDNLTSIDITNSPPGIYFLVIQEKDKTLQTFKIIKD